MTMSPVDTTPPDEDQINLAPNQYQYDLRLEIGAEKYDGPVPVVMIFQELVQRMKNAIDPGTPLVVMTAFDQLYFAEKEMKSDEFQKAFQVAQSDGQKSKVLLGFKSAPLSGCLNSSRKSCIPILSPTTFTYVSIPVVSETVSRCIPLASCVKSIQTIPISMS